MRNTMFNIIWTHMGHFGINEKFKLERPIVIINAVT